MIPLGLSRLLERHCPSWTDMDIKRAIAKIERQTGCVITLQVCDTVVSVVDPELNCHFIMKLGSPSQHESEMLELHKRIYSSRRREKYYQQDGKCAQCGSKLKGMGECDHIQSRGAHGRNDRLSNLQIVCAPFTGGCDYHHVKHTKGFK